MLEGNFLAHAQFKFAVLWIYLQSKWKFNNLELIQPNSTSFPRRQKGKEYKQLKRHEVNQPKRKAKRKYLSQKMAARLSEIKWTKSQRQTESGRIAHRIETINNKLLECVLKSGYVFNPSPKVLLWFTFGPREGLLTHQYIKTAHI